MQGALNSTRKAAFTFLSSLTLNEPTNSTGFKGEEDANLPPPEIPPDPNLAPQVPIPNPSPPNQFHKPIRSRRDRLATNFLSHSTFAPAEVSEGEGLNITPPPDVHSTLPSSLQLQGPPHRNFAMMVVGDQGKRVELGDPSDSSSSNLSSSSDDEPQLIRTTGDCTEEENKLGSSRKSSYLVELASIGELGNSRAMSTSPVFAKRTGRRSRTRKGSNTLPYMKRNTDSYAHLLSAKHTLV